MKVDQCAICGGNLERRLITYTNEHNGQLVAIGNVPAEVCSTCGEAYFAPKVAHELHRIIQKEQWTQTLKVPYTSMTIPS